MANSIAVVPSPSGYAGVGLGLEDSFRNFVTEHVIHNDSVTLPDGTVANCMPTQITHYMLQTWFSKVATNSTLSGLFINNNQFLDFLIPQGTPDTLKGAYVKFTFANADAANACQLPPSEFLLSMFQELSDGVNPSVIFTNQQMWYLNNCWRNMEEYYHYAKLSNTVGNPITATSIANLYSATDIVPVSSTASCYLSLDFSPLVQSRAFLPAIFRQPRFRLYPQSNPWINSNVNGDVTLQSCELIMWGNVYAPVVKERLMSYYRSRPTITRTFTIQAYQNINACTSGVKIGPLTMTNIFGECAALVFFLQSYEATYNSTNLWTEATTGIIDWTTMTLKNGTATPLWYENVERMVLRHMIPMTQNPQLFSAAVPIYAFPHTVDFGKTMRQLAHYGAYNYNGTQTLELYPSATATGASGNALVYAWGIRYSGMMQTETGFLNIIRY